ncbi:family 3 carbohydrate esterase [Piromyces sp. E2]|nr:family 3 carbohydrate esterase [Piromyces sp. E2]|eukprot:OUM70534.1 family 3 carbohydrate esterase [Piromyces sp. E2]
MKLIQPIAFLLSTVSLTLAQWPNFGGGDFWGGFPGFGGNDNNNNNNYNNNNNNNNVAVSGDTIKIMPVGDSITFGMGENGGYRKYLYNSLTQKGYKIDMVGPEGSNSASANGIQYDDNHAGYSGFQIKEIPDWGRQQGGEGSLFNKLKSKNAVKQAQPDIILLIIGTNDMTANRSMDACVNDLRSLLDLMLADMPSGGIIFMGSIPEFTAYGGNAQRVANYNNTVKKVAEEYASKGKNVRFADVHSSLNGTADLGSDQLHPNGNGYKKMGNYWAEVLDEYLKSTKTSNNDDNNKTDDNKTDDKINDNNGTCSVKITSQGYKCCSNNCEVVYTDADGTWGVENNNWCGCGTGSSVCVGAQGYPCCKTTTKVEYVDQDGNWGVENNDWCIIRN